MDITYTSLLTPLVPLVPQTSKPAGDQPDQDTSQRHRHRHFIANQLNAHYQERGHLLANQPTFNSTVQAVLQSALAADFPQLGVPNSIRPDQIFLTTFIKLYDAHGKEYRERTSSQSLTSLFLQYLVNRQSTTFTNGLTGLFTNRTDLDDDKMIPALRAAHVAINKIEKIIRESGDDFQRGYEQAVDDFWNKPNTKISNAIPRQWLSMGIGAEIRATITLLTVNTPWSDDDKAQTNQLLRNGPIITEAVIKWQKAKIKRAFADRQTKDPTYQEIVAAISAIEKALYEATVIQRELDFYTQYLLDLHVEYLLDVHMPSSSSETTRQSVPEQVLTIYGTNTVPPPNSGYTLPQREQRINAYADRVKTQLGNIESGSEGERNVKFQNARQFMIPSGYFSGGLLAAGYDPHEAKTVTFTTYTGMGKPETLNRTNKHSYFAWEIAAGALEHDKVERGGPLTFQFMEIEPNDKLMIENLESVGKKLQEHWEKDIATPTRDASGTLAQRSGKADTYAVRGTLQSLLNDKESFEKLSPEGQAAVGRTLEQNGQVIIPNLYGYPLGGYAFIPYIPYNGNYEHRPNQGLMLDLDKCTVREVHGDEDFANWAKKNRDSLLRAFNTQDAQGGKDAHWPRAGEILDHLIAGDDVHYEGYYNHVSDQQIPVRELFNYTRSRGSYYQLKYGNLTPRGDNSIASWYQAVNANNAVWSDQTEVFGSSQQRWKVAKEFWGNTFGYVPIVGNAGNVVFGVHDGIYGMTADDRIQGTAAVAISTLQLIHEILPIAAEIALGEPPTALDSSIQNYRWEYNLETSDFEFVQPPFSNPEAVSVNQPGIRKIVFEEKEYYVVDEPDTGDGVHYLLRVQDPNDSSRLVSSGKIAKPDEAGVWKRRGVAGGAPGQRGSKVTSDIIKAWQEITKNDKTKKNSRSLAEFLEPYGISSSSFGEYATVKGELMPKGRFLFAETLYKFRSTTAHHLRAWRDMTEVERKVTPRYQFAIDNRIYLNDLAKETRINGELTWEGQYKVDKDEGKQFHPPTTEELIQWRDTPENQRELTSWHQFARDRNINPLTFRSRIKRKGGLSAVGQYEIDKGNESFRLPTARDLEDWRDLSETDRKKTTREKFATNRKVNPVTFRHEVETKGGLTPYGKLRLNKAEGIKYHEVTLEELVEWRDMPEADRKGTPWYKFALDREIDLYSFQNDANTNGTLKAIGEARIQSSGTKFKPLTAQDLIDWRDMPEADRAKTTRDQFANSRGINPQRLRYEALGTGELRPFGEFRINKNAGIKYHEMTSAELVEWRDMPEADRKTTPWHKFALDRHIDLGSFTQLVRTNGQLSDVAKFMIKAANRKKTPVGPSGTSSTSQGAGHGSQVDQPSVIEDDWLDDDPPILEEQPSSQTVQEAPMPLAKAKKYASDRAIALQAQLSSYQRSKVTMAVGVLKNNEGKQIKVISSSIKRGYLPKELESDLDPKEFVVRGNGHAEYDIVEWAAQNDYTVETIGAGRPICSDCAQAISNAGAVSAHH